MELGFENDSWIQFRFNQSFVNWLMIGLEGFGNEIQDCNFF